MATKGKERRIGRYYTVGGKQHMMYSGTFPKADAAALKAKRKRQGYTVATRTTSKGVELYVRQD